MEAKDKRLQIRVEPSEKDLIERAAARSHLSVSAFVLSVVGPHAERVLAESDVIRLSADAAAAFAQALLDPSVPNARLAEALRRPREFTWVE